jgi:putative transposase
MDIEQLKELKRLQKENERLRLAVSDLALDKLFLKESASENF